MNKDLTNLKKWFKELGLEIDERLDNDILKKLIPPQRQDMWRNIMRHVLPEERVELIRKSIVLHKLQTRQKPLMAKVESDEDLKNALKYEELIMKYDEIQNDILVAKENNRKLKMDLDKKNLVINKVISNIENEQRKVYLSKHKTDYYNKCVERLKDKPDICDYFSTEVNEDLTQTDYEDALIVCFTEVDEAKTSGVMIEDVKIGKPLCSTIYKTIREKSPANLILTIEKNILDHLNKSHDFLTKTKLIMHKSDIEEDYNIGYNELHSKLIQKQLDLKLKLSNTLNEKEDILKRFQEKIISVQNEIISQYKLNYIFCNDNDLVIFKQNLKEAFNSIIKKSIDCTIVNGLENDSEKEIFNINDDLLEEIQSLNENINQKQTLVQEMLSVLGQKEGFGLAEIKSVYETTVEDYLKKNENFQIDKKLTSLKHISYMDIDTLKLTPKSVPKSNVHFHTLQDLNKYSEIIDVLSEFSAKFNQFNNVTSDEINFNEIKEKENIHKTEFDHLVTQTENTMSVLDSSIENCKIISETSKLFK